MAPARHGNGSLSSSSGYLDFARGLELSRPKVLVALSLIIAIHVGASAVWMYRNGFFHPDRPPFHDCAYFRLEADNIQRAIHEQGVTGLLSGASHHDRPHPPIMAMLNAVVSLPFGRIDTKTQWCVEAIYLAGLVVALYLLGRDVLGAPGRALLFAFFASAAPVFIASTRVALPKFSMMVTVLFALHALTRSSLFSRRGWSVAFGFWAGLSLMTMMLAPVYLVGSSATAFVFGLRRGPRAAVLKNAGLAALMLAAIAATWYPDHWTLVRGYAATVTSEEGQKFFSSEIGAWTPERWLYYPISLVNNGLGFFLAAAVAVVLIAWIAGGHRPVLHQAGPALPTRTGLVLTVGAAVSFVIVTLGQVNAESQYVMNLAALVLLLAHWCGHSMSKRWLRIAALTLLAGGTLVSAALTFRPVDQDTTPEPQGRWIIPIPGFKVATALYIVGPMDTYGGGPARAVGVSASPNAEKWPLAEVVDLMEANRTFGDIKLGSILGVGYPYMTPGNLEYVARQRGLRMRVVNTRGFPPFSQETLDVFADDAEFVISDPQNLTGGGETARTERSALAGIEATGATLTKLLERRVTPLAAVALYKIAHPDRTIDLVPTLPAGAIPATATFDTGWQLLGLLHAPGRSNDTVIVTTFWKVDPAAEPGLKVVLRTQRPGGGADGWPTLADSDRDLVVPRGVAAAGQILALRAAPLPFPSQARLLLIVSSDESRRRATPVAVLRSDFRDCGPYTMIVLVRDENGVVVMPQK